MLYLAFNNVHSDNCDAREELFYQAFMTDVIYWKAELFYQTFMTNVIYWKVELFYQAFMMDAICWKVEQFYQAFMTDNNSQVVGRPNRVRCPLTVLY